MKSLKNLSGVKVLNKKAQKEINGGVDRCLIMYCLWRCVNGKCVDGPVYYI